MGRLAAVAVLLACAARLDAQLSPTRVAILVAEDSRAATLHDLSVIRAGLHSPDSEIVRIAVRALGRLEDPSLIPDILPYLRAELPEIRAEAANAAGQAAPGLSEAARRPAVRPASRSTERAVGLDSIQGVLIDRLRIESEPTVRGVIAETLGRLPYRAPEQAQRAETVLVEAFQGDQSSEGVLGIAKGLEALVRLQRKLTRPGDGTVTALNKLAAPTESGSKPGAARIRRLALEALIGADAVSDGLLARAAADTDAQVRRLAMRAAGASDRGVTGADTLTRGLADEAAMVRYEALRSLSARRGDGACGASLAAVDDRDAHVALLALDQLGACSGSPDVVLEVLEHNLHQVADTSRAASVHGWQRAAHALVSLAAVAPDRATSALAQFTGSPVWQLRMYAARAAAAMKMRSTLDRIASDENDNVVEVAVEALSKLAGHDADAVYIPALARSGYQVARAAAIALDGTPAPDKAVPALQAALQRLDAEDHDNSRDARSAIVETLTKLSVTPQRLKPPRITTELNADDLRRLGSARARLTIRGLGSFELALFSSETPATVMRFARLAEQGYYNGLTFHRVVPNFVIQGGSPGANEYVGDAAYMRDEVGLWPHVRGAVGISTRGRDTGDAQIFIDLVDNPRLDHQYTVFGQVLSGMDIVDAVLEGDIIEKIEIVPGV